MEKIMQLNSNWTLSYKDGKVNASVPGDVSLDLYRAGKIADPYFGLNHKDQTWIHWNDYVYENKFDVSADILDKEEVLLEFDSIDTFAEITLNGKYLGNTENMFLKYTYSVKELLKDKGNVLTVKLISTRQKMDEIDTADYFGCFNVQRIFVRKAQCHFGWDWAPDLPGFGICGDVRIKGVSKSRIDNVYCRTHNDGNVTFIVQLNYTVRDKMDLEDNIVKASDPACKNDILRYSIAKNPNKPLTDDNTITYEHKVIG